MSDEEILDAVGGVSCYNGDTDGRRTFTLDRPGFVDRLHRIGKYVCIETNGTRFAAG